MGYIYWTYTFANGDSGLGTKLQQNFTDATDVLNGNLDGTNLRNTTNFNIESMEVSSADFVNIINPNLATDLSLTFGSGSPKKLMITDSNDVSLFEIDDSGNITIPLGMTNLYPIGTVTYFTGVWVDNSTIKGWYKCDGNNGTPDLEDLFIRGGSTPGQTGGFADLTLGQHTHSPTVGNNSASHTHTVGGSLAYATVPSHTHSLYEGWTTSGGYLAAFTYSGDINTTAVNTGYASAHSHTYSFTTSTQSDDHRHTVTVSNAGVGEDGVGDNLPSYYTLIPICRMV